MMNPVIPYLDSSIIYDINHGRWTQDLAQLRYHGAIRVFLWDDLQDFDQMLGSLELKEDEATSQLENSYLNAISEKSYVPYYNIGAGVDDYYAFCLEEHEDLLMVDAPLDLISQPLPLKGRMMTVSLELLSYLDHFYKNGKNFERVEISVRPGIDSKSSFKCFAWLNSVDHIFDEGGETTVEKDGIELSCFTSTTKGGKEYYHYSCE